MTASHPECIATSAAVSGPQPHGPHIEWADSEKSSLDCSDPSTRAAQAIGSKMISPNLNNIIVSTVTRYQTVT
jgi:hypothetical protein